MAEPSVIDLIRSGALILDVRTEEEYSEGAFPNSVNVPVSELEQRLNELGDKKRPVVVYCRSGQRSEKAKSILLRSGFQSVVNAGGLVDMPHSNQ